MSSSVLRLLPADAAELCYLTEQLKGTEKKNKDSASAQISFYSVEHKMEMYLIN